MRIYNITIMLVIMLLSMTPTKSFARVIDNTLRPITSVVEEVFEIFKSFETPTPDKSIKKKKKKHKHDDDDDYYGGGDDDDGWHNDDDDDDGNDIPLDGGLSFLAIAGAGLGIKKVADYRKKNK